MKRIRIPFTRKYRQVIQSKGWNNRTEHVSPVNANFQIGCQAIMLGLIAALLWLLVSSPLCARTLDKIVIYDLNINSKLKWDRLLQSWKRYKPCKNTHVDLELHTFRKEIQIGHNTQCFKSVSIYTPPYHQKSYEMERLIFKKVMIESIDQHVLFISVDCVPIIENWLDEINNLIIEPNAKFWVKTSLASSSEHSLYSGDVFYHHLLSSGLYHFTMDFIKKFKEISEFVQVNYPTGPFSHSFHRYLYDARVMEDARYIFSRFIVDDFIFVANSKSLSRPPEAILQLVE